MIFNGRSFRRRMVGYSDVAVVVAPAVVVVAVIVTTVGVFRLKKMQ